MGGDRASTPLFQVPTLPPFDLNAALKAAGVVPRPVTRENGKALAPPPPPPPPPLPRVSLPAEQTNRYVRAFDPTPTVKSGGFAVTPADKLKQLALRALRGAAIGAGITGGPSVAAPVGFGAIVGASQTPPNSIADGATLGAAVGLATVVLTRRKGGDLKTTLVGVAAGAALGVLLPVVIDQLAGFQRGLSRAFRCR